MAAGRVLFVLAFVFLYIADISSAAVSDTACTSDGTECDGIANAECDISLTSPKCKCDKGYKENVDTCKAIVAVSATTCTSGGTECDGIANAECDTSPTSPKCKCDEGYEECEDTCKPIGSVLFVWAFVLLYIVVISNAEAVSDTTCTSGGTECDCIAHAECDTSLTKPKCKCDEGYKENENTCEAIESGAVSMKSAVGLVFGSLILHLIQAL